MSTPRHYPIKDLKILWGLSAGRCAFPECHTLCIAEQTEFDSAAVIGKIAHIQSHSDSGPRANPSLSSKERDSYDNWILLCGTHHDLVDVQPNTYTVDDLRSWKENHEKWVSECLTDEMPEISFLELEMVSQAILGSPQTPSSDFTVTYPAEKMRRNDLTEKIHFLITLGVGKAREVQNFINDMNRLDYEFSERLISGFVTEYKKLVNEGFRGDSLFEALRDFAGGTSSDFKRQAAGLAVLTYLFEKCEVFE